MPFDPVTGLPTREFDERDRQASEDAWTGARRANAASGPPQLGSFGSLQGARMYGITTGSTPVESLGGRYLTGADTARGRLDARNFQENEARAQQQAFAEALLAQAQGRAGPSAAEVQMQRGLDSSVQNAMAMAAAQRGNPLLAQRQAQQAAGQMSADVAGQTAALRAQEQLAAQQLYQQQLAGMRGMDLQGQQMWSQRELGLSGIGENRALSQAQLDQQTRLANQSAYQRAIDQAIQAYGVDQGVSVQQSAQDAQVAGAGIGAGAALLGALAMACDKHLKKGKRRGEEEIRELFEELRPVEYEYNDDAGERPGRHVGILAQDLQRSKAGRAMVGKDQRGMLNVDMKRALAAALAGTADLHARVADLEGGK